jgi:hypothetical protein
LTLGVRSRRSCVFESPADERREEVWGESKFSASLHRTVPHPREMWDCILQAEPATILSWSLQHLPHDIIEEIFEGTYGHHVA